MARRARPTLVPQARAALEWLKHDVAGRFGVARRPNTGPAAADPTAYRRVLEALKWQIAEELGLDEKVRRLGWADMPSRECGAVGGNLGGQIGGQMVRRMIALAEERMWRGAGLPPAGPARRPGPYYPR